MKSRKKINQSIFFIVSFILCLATLLMSLPVNFVNSLMTHADTDVYSSVIDDLQKDENFDIDNFPEIENDYSVKVVQVAENSDNDLFVYTYQPSASDKVKLTTISISQGINDNASWSLYNLTFLNSENTLYKYKVEDIELLTDVVRYYDISEIHREFINGVDKEPDENQVVDEVPVVVGQRWTACTLNNEVYYSCNETEVIEISEKYTGYVHYDDGFWEIGRAHV